MGRRLIDFRNVHTLILDEADRMMDMGFIPSVRRITAALPKTRQTMCFSATMEDSVAQLVNGCMRKPVRIALGSTLKPCSTVKLQAIQLAPEDKIGVLQQLLSKETGRCLVFTRTKRGTERLAKRLAADGFAATMIHGNRSQSQRTAAIHGFQQGRFNVLVATDVASRGIHVDSVAHVINFDMPEIAEDFIHRVGRTGRAGERGVASTFITRDQVKELQQLERTLNLRMEHMRVRRAQPDQARAV
jgi:ATP-dependent RNA helicase RhlE